MDRLTVKDKGGVISCQIDGLACVVNFVISRTKAFERALKLQKTPFWYAPVFGIPAKGKIRGWLNHRICLCWEREPK